MTQQPAPDRAPVLHETSVVNVPGIFAGPCYEAVCTCGMITNLNIPVEWSARQFADAHEIMTFRAPPSPRYFVQGHGRPGNLSFHLNCHDCFDANRQAVGTWPQPQNPEAFRSLKADVHLAMVQHETEVHSR